MRTNLLHLALLVLAATAAFAQTASPDWTELPPVAGDPLGARIFRLKNGLTVMLSVNPATPSVQTLIAVRAGSKNDPADHTGLAHYLEHMLFKGTDRLGARDYEQERPLLEEIERLYEQYNHSADAAERTAIYRRIDSVSGLAARFVIANEYDRLVSSLGAGHTNAWTWYDQTVYTNSIPSNQIERWLEIEGERFRKPVIRLFHTELEAVYEEKNISLDRDESRQEDLAFRLLLPHHPYGTQTTLGTVEHLKNPSITEIRRYLERYYVPNNMAIILAGDLDPAAVLPAIVKRFGSMKPSPVPPLAYGEERPIGAAIDTSVSGPDPESVVIGFRAPGVKLRDGYLLDIVNQLLDYKEAGLIDLHLRQTQRVLDASSSAYTFNDYSAFFLNGRPNPGQSLEEVRDLLLTELRRIRDGDFTDQQLAAIMLNRRIERTRSLESNPGRAYTMLGAFVPDMDWAEYVRRLNETEPVTRGELIEFARRYLADEYVVVYKRIGEADVVKVPKPAITPVALDRESVSTFARGVLDREVAPITPAFVDFATELSTLEVRPGLKLTHRANAENDLFTLRYAFDFGREADPLAPIAAGLLPLLGAGGRSARDVAQTFFALGCDMSFSVERESLTLSVSGPDAAFEKAVALLEDLLHRASPDQKALDAMVERTIKSREEGKQSKHVVLWEGLWNYSLYGEKNPFNTVLSTEQLRALRAPDLVRWIDALPGFRHEVLYYGPRTAESIVSTIRRVHATPEVLRDVPATTAFTPVRREGPVVYFVDLPMVQAEILWLRPTGTFDPALLPNVEMFNEYFGGGMGAIVFQTIREARALAYSTSGRIRKPNTRTDPFLSFAYIGTQADKVPDALAAMNELLTTLPKSQEAYNAAMASLRNQMESERTVRTEVLDAYLSARRLGVDRDLRRDVYAALGTASLDDLVRFHRERYAGGPFAIAVVGSRDRVNLDALRAYGNLVELTTKEVFGF